MNKIIKITLSLVLSALFSYSVILCVSLAKMQNRFDSELYDNVVRLHILANSDSDYDQNAKMVIKDSVAKYVTALTSNAKNAEEASEIIKNNLENIHDYVNYLCYDHGFDYTAKIEFSKENYPVRYYDNFVFPAGKYQSLRIMLGESKGRNWWCVLYPSLCVKGDNDTQKVLADAGISEKTTEYITDEKYKIRFFLLDILGL